MTSSVLILFAHPAYHRSRANRALVEAVKGMDGVTFRDLYEEYPDYLIDVDAEQEMLLQHDALVLQHPFYWYSAPSLMKEWLDLVLVHGWAYGFDGRAVEGKYWMQAITAGGRAEAYEPEGLNRFSIPEMLRPFEATANLCRMHWRDPHILHASHLHTQSALDAAARGYRARILALQREAAAATSPAAKIPE